MLVQGGVRPVDPEGVEPSRTCLQGRPANPLHEPISAETATVLPWSRRIEPSRCSGKIRDEEQNAVFRRDSMSRCQPRHAPIREEAVGVEPTTLRVCSFGLDLPWEGFWTPEVRSSSCVVTACKAAVLPLDHFPRMPPKGWRGRQESNLYWLACVLVLAGCPEAPPNGIEPSST